MLTHLPRALLVLAMATAATAIASAPARAASDSELDQDARAALQVLYADSPAAKALGEKAFGILVFPNITKAGFIIGAQGGDGILLEHGKTVGYYNSTAISYGLQAGVQTYGNAMFFMSEAVLKSFEKSKGWEVGVGPNVVVVDAGAAKDVTTLTGKADVFAFIFNQKGLMAGVGIKGSKITKLSR